MPTDLDVYKPERWRDDALFRLEVRAAYAELIATGLTDAIRLLHPDERIYTFRKYFRNAFARDAGLRIDRFLLSPSLRERLQTCGVDKFARAWEHTSDHAPVGIELHDDSAVIAETTDGTGGDRQWQRDKISMPRGSQTSFPR